MSAVRAAPKRKRLDRYRRALARDMVRRGETKSDAAGFLGCSHRAVSKAVHNEYKVQDDLDEDADYLCGKLGELVDVDEMEDDEPRMKREFREDEKDIKPIAHTRGRTHMRMPSVASDDYELTSDAMFVDDGDVGSDSGDEFHNDSQLQERQSARLRGIKAPVVRMSVSPTWQARQKRARTRSQSAQSVVEISSDDDEGADTRSPDVIAPAEARQVKKKVRHDEPAEKPVEMDIQHIPTPQQTQIGDLPTSPPPREHWTAAPTPPVFAQSQEFKYKQSASINLAVRDRMLRRLRLFKDEISRMFFENILSILQDETRKTGRQARKNTGMELSARILALNNGIEQRVDRSASRCTWLEQPERPFLASLSIAKKATHGSSVVNIKPAVARRQPIADASSQKSSSSGCVSANDVTVGAPALPAGSRLPSFRLQQPAALSNSSSAARTGSPHSARTKVESMPNVLAGKGLRPNEPQALSRSKLPSDDPVGLKAQGCTPSDMTTKSPSSSSTSTGKTRPENSNRQVKSTIEDIDQKNGDVKNTRILSAMNLDVEHVDVVAAININTLSDLRRWSELDEQAHRLIIDTDIRRRGISTFRYVKLLTAVRGPDAQVKGGGQTS